MSHTVHGITFVSKSLSFLLRVLCTRDWDGRLVGFGDYNSVVHLGKEH